MMRLYRLSHWLYNLGVPVLPHLIYVFNRLVFSAVIPPSVRIGRDVVLGYHGLCIVIHRRVVIGDNVVIAPGVTIGGRSELLDVPVIESDVLIGAGAKILGPVRIGRGAKIGANAVVLQDVPASAVAVGIPARLILRGDGLADEQALDS
ncbi:MAG: serine acetyltransferase [Hydrogenophilales bacterium]|nr:serine acetyltransferase [Hydrogenophilales bacterium]